MKNFWITFILITCSVLLLLSPEQINEAFVSGISICLTQLLPSMFPFFFLSSMLSSTGCIQKLGRTLSPVMEKYFHLPGATGAVLIQGLVGGYPLGAKATADLHLSGILDRSDAEHVLLFCNNAGPAFIISVVGVGVFQSIWIGVALYLVHAFSAIIIGRLFRFPNYNQSPPTPDKVEEISVFRAFCSSAFNAGKTAFTVCIYLLLFRTAIALIQPVTVLFGKYKLLLLGFSELAGAMTQLQFSAFSEPFKICLASALLGWGGLCVHVQSLSLLNQAGLSGKNYIKGKFLHCALSFIATSIIVPFFPLPVGCCATSNNHTAITQMILLICLAIWILILVKITSGKLLCKRL